MQIKNYGGIADRQDIDFALTKTDEILAAIPAPVTTENGVKRINPHVTLFEIAGKNNNAEYIYMGIYHVKPIYYLHQNGEWRPLSEVTTYHGNKRIDLCDDWDTKIDLRYLAWLIKRAEVLGGAVRIPSPYRAGLLPLREYAKQNEVAATIHFTVTDFYPDANVETTTVDGRVQWFSTSDTWSTAHGDTAGTSADDSSSSMYLQVYHRSGSNLGIDRFFALFDTSALTSGATISDATLNIYTDGKGNAEADGKDYFSVVQSSPLTNIALITGDYDQCGAVTNPTKGSSDVDVDTITINQYFTLTLNATGRGWISKTGVTKLGVREGHDIENEDPNAGVDGVYIHLFCAEYTGTSRDPKLTVTYTTGTNYTKDLAETVTAVETVAKKTTKPFTEAVTFVETVTRTTGKYALESITGVETVNRAITRAITDTITVAETITRAAGKAVTETVTLVETVAKATTRTITEAITAVETTVANRVLTRELTDTIEVLETTARQAGKVITEAVTAVETVTRQITVALSITATVTIQEVVGTVRTLYRTITENVTMVETVSKLFSFGRQIVESITPTDRIRGLLNGVNMFYGAKYVQKTLSYFNKYLDPK